jgi:hypothetical protein
MFERGVSGFFRDLLERQQIDHHGQGILQVTAFHVSLRKCDRLDHNRFLCLVGENLQRYNNPVKQDTARIRGEQLTLNKVKALLFPAIGEIRQ